MSHYTRRHFVRDAVLAAAATRLAPSLSAQAPQPPRGAAQRPVGDARPVVRWLDGTPPAEFPGATWGMPWPRGLHGPDTAFTARSGSGQEIPLQSWPLATWPDGSLKWTAHAVPGGSAPAESLEIQPGRPAALKTRVSVSHSGDTIEVNTGVLRATVARSGRVLVRELAHVSGNMVRNGRLVLLHQGTLANEEPAAFAGEISNVVVEQNGPVRAVVRVEGKHAAERGGRAWLPFVLRLYFHAGSEAVRAMHTIVYDGDPSKDFIRGLGLRFDVPMRGDLHDRHLRFSGEEGGVFGEAVRTVTGLRRDPGAAVRRAQVEGRATPPAAEWSPQVSTRMHWVPAFSDWSLFQSSADGFEIRKRTKPTCTWITSARGNRAGGLVYAGSPQGGFAIGLRNFWQSYPAELAVTHAAAETAQVTAWMWSPSAEPMDLRGYHDGMGQDTYQEQLDALNITYEDYEPGYDTPEGVARTSELHLWVLPATPTRERLAAMGAVVQAPAVLTATPAYLHTCSVFGGLWSPGESSTPSGSAIDERLAWNFDFYKSQQDQRRWYGFWNYGDVMHSYDVDRHEWKYDVGGFAWDNSELSTDIWLWLYFLRSGRADVFRFAEAMTRHTGEVDVHHIGRFAPLGSRHNVLHWGCSAKQLRISTAANRRYYYYLTGDERVGDLMREQIEATRALAVVQANRKVAPDRVTAPDPNAKEVYAGFGTDWGSAASAWLTEWERTGDAKSLARLRASMRSIAAQPLGFFTGGARMNLDTGEFAISDDTEPRVSHLSAVFGLVEVCAELIQLIDEPAFRQAWLDYCVWYNAPAEEQTRKFGAPLRGISLQQGHSRLTAYAAKLTGDASLAQRAWNEFRAAEGSEGHGANPPLKVKRITGPAVLRPVDEAPWMSTNGAAQWGLAAIQCTALLGDSP